MSEAIAAQLGVDLVGQAASPEAIAAQLGVDLVGQTAQPFALAVQLGIEIIAPLPVLPPRFARERNFPLGFRNWPPRAGQPWRFSL